jgi:hypothetical protein
MQSQTRFDGMFAAKQYRDKASEYADRGKSSNGSEEAGEFARLEKSFTALADNEEWLSKNYQKTVHADAVDAPEAPTLADQEEHILRCLGAAVILEWNGLPSEIRRKLFDCATTMGDALDIASLRGQVARFVHKHQDARNETLPGKAHGN